METMIEKSSDIAVQMVDVKKTFDGKDFCLKEP